jgi:hypothetical protein
MHLVPVLAAGLATATVAFAGLAGIDKATATLSQPPSADAMAEIPTEQLASYQEAAASCPGMAWQILAAIGKVETDHGRSTFPGVHSGANSAGAMGPMQFLGPTWQAYGVDGDKDGRRDVFNPTDAIWGAANYLCKNGAGQPNRLRGAIWHYNQSQTYVTTVLDHARRYGWDPAPSPVGSGVAGGLVTVGGITVAASLGPHLAALLQAAAVSGLRLGGGGYRSYQTQIDARKRNGCLDVFTAPASSCRVPTARPGQSMHERGLAIDFTCNGALIQSHASSCWQWLSRNAASHGLYNLPSESWHWSTNGR